ncbi:hypothetical protein CCP3SC1AL1_990012 [Gammaproteobacteria bacterium]
MSYNSIDIIPHHANATANANKDSYIINISEREVQCCICLYGNLQEIVFFNCKHFTCKKCWIKLKKNDLDYRCPICNSIISEMYVTRHIPKIDNKVFKSLYSYNNTYSIYDSYHIYIGSKLPNVSIVRQGRPVHPMIFSIIALLIIIALILMIGYSRQAHIS